LATLAQLTAAAPRLALVGLAKNTGKTVTLNALLAELASAREQVGVTSVGRDGEKHDVIDFRIEKPLVRLSAGDLVATTDGLLGASGVPHELLERTGMRTPMGEVLLARLKGAGTIEIAGPSAASDTRAVADSMLDQGARRVVIDGAIDRRAASSPEVSDGLVMSTGAILSEDIEEVVARTVESVALVRVAPLGAEGEEARLRELAAAIEPGVSALVDDAFEVHPLPERFVLTAEPAEVAERLRAAGAPRALLVAGALPQRFLDGLVPQVRRARDPFTVVVSDATRLFLADRDVAHYARAGVELRVLRPIELLALTVNPVAPQSHSFESGRLRAALAEAIPDVPIFDVLHPSYAADGAMPPRSGAHPGAGPGGRPG
jgi:hypothetical protein